MIILLLLTRLDYIIKVLNNVILVGVGSWTKLKHKTTPGILQNNNRLCDFNLLKMGGIVHVILMQSTPPHMWHIITRFFWVTITSFIILLFFCCLISFIIFLELSRLIKSHYLNLNPGCLLAFKYSRRHMGPALCCRLLNTIWNWYWCACGDISESFLILVNTTI